MQHTSFVEPGPSSAVAGAVDSPPRRQPLIIGREQGGPRLVCTFGEWPAETQLSVALRAYGEEVGMIALGPRRSGRPYAGADRKTLEDLADQVAALIVLSGKPPFVGHRLD